MTDAARPERAPAARATGAKRTLVAASLIISGMTCVVALGRHLEARRPQAVESAADEEGLYVRGETARRLSLGFNGLAADWYWIRTLQYVGKKVLSRGGPALPDDLSALDLRMLAPLLEQTTTLDPQFLAAYEYGAMLLPAIDREAAVRLVEKGIEANPREWRLRHHLGYIRWQSGQFREASRAYVEGAGLPGAPGWMRPMAARLEAEGGDRAVAREMFARMYEEAQDEQIRQLAEKRLAQIQSFDERDLIRAALETFRARAGRCPSSWAEAFPVLRRARGLRFDAASAPLDPSGTPYVLNREDCGAELDARSGVPHK